MTIFNRLGLVACSAILTLGVFMLPGCGEGPATEPGKSIGITNPTADNDLKHVTLDNEADNMKLLKSKTKPAAAGKTAGPTLPGQPGN